MPTDLQKARELFLHAVGKLPTEQWEDYVAEACGGDSDLAQQVACLLQVHQEAGSFLDAPAPGLEHPGTSTAMHPGLSEGPGAVIGAYKLLQQIGEGGMGVVFMAEQTVPLQRTVALKIIKPGMDTRQVIARFEAERQAVAMMDHPHIAKVLDAGTTDSGRPYFVMELVKGMPITKYCDEKQLPLRARLELFMQVCQAVQHAHQKGVIHRDIKPNNVLVAEYDNQAVPKVIDFGVAKATAQKLTERTMFTEFGQVLGTMEYMSPEQAKFNQLDVDTRSDIYSLGVLLYELLAGSTPFEGKRLHEAAFDEMLRIIREEEPPKPSTKVSSSDTLPSIAANRHTEPARLSKDVRGELDWIVMKALEKDRNRRYETASGFAADIERHLHDEPVEAGPPSAAYRFRKFARRNKAAFLTASAVAASLIIGLALASIGLVQARRQAEIARAEAIQSAKMTQRATEVQQFLQEILTSINPDAQVGAAVTVQQVLERAGEKIDPSFENQPAVRAVLHDTIGKTYYGLQLYAPATTHLHMAVDLRRRYLPEEQLELADALLDLAKSETVINANLNDALANCREAAAIFAAEAPESDHRLAFAQSLEAHLAGTGESVAQTWSAAALPLLSLLPDAQLARLPAGFGRAIAEAKQSHRVGDAAGALAALRRYHLDATERMQKLCATGDRVAIQQFVREHYGPFMDVPWGRQIVPLAGVNRARQLKIAGENPLLIEAVLREAIDAGHTVWGAEHPHIAWGLHELATLLRVEGRLSEAEVAAREAFEMRQKVLGDENPETVKSLDVLIDVLQKENKTADLEKLRREATELIEQPSADKKLPKEDHANTSNSTSAPPPTTES